MHSIDQLRRDAMEAQIRTARHTRLSAGRVVLLLALLGLAAIVVATWVPVWCAEDDSAAEAAMDARRKALDAQAPNSAEPFRRMLSPQ